MRTRAGRMVVTLWIILLLGTILTILLFPSITDPNTLSTCVKQHPNRSVLIFLGVCILKAPTLFPITPIIIAGTIIFPEDPLTVILSTWVGSQVGSVVHYFFPHWMGIDEWAHKKYPKQFEKVHTRMERNGHWVVFFISFIPVIPAELVYYTSGITGVPFWRYQLAIGISHAIVFTIYVLVLGELISLSI